MTKIIIFPEDAPEYCPSQFYWELDKHNQRLTYESMAVLYACHPNTIALWFRGKTTPTPIDRRLTAEIRERWIRQGRILIPAKRNCA